MRPSPPIQHLAPNRSEPLPAFGVAAVCTNTHSTVTVRGDIDLATAPELVAFVANLADGQPVSVTLDVAGVTFMDCSGINALMSIREICDRRGIAVRVASAPAQVLRVLQLAQMDGMLRLPSLA